MVAAGRAKCRARRPPTCITAHPTHSEHGWICLPAAFLPLGRALLLAPLLLPLATPAVEWVGTVVGMADGDTLTLLDAGKTTHRIRIDGIDAPERTQAYGQRARQSLADLSQGRTAHANCPKNDRYGRAVLPRDGRRRGCRPGADPARTGLALHEVRG